jgi:hypothetical protein
MTTFTQKNMLINRRAIGLENLSKDAKKLGKLSCLTTPVQWANFSLI